MTTRPKETDLYAPIKSLLESQGYEVKSEIGAADVVGVKAGENSPVIVELKTSFALTLFHQGIARQAITDAVYVAVPRGKGRAWMRSLKENTKLCRRLGLGLITVRLRDQLTQIHCDPAPFQPRKSKRRQSLLLKEFAKREGDPNTGGAPRTALVTAYRQDALRIAEYLQDNGPSKGAVVRDVTGVAEATRIMRDNHYGWFEREALGIYRLSERGKSRGA